ncbi:thiamine phosphate synthase [SAR86 cluster bacterium]|nr:thiamine phosphate synthase [SAR86 cluster bacterium]|tara:strand:+ start:14355 stop:14972 length:618 start_codon:yes stop_codon:yes gene_type:complete
MLSNKLRGLYFIVGESQFLSHDFDNILSKSLDLGLNLLQYRFDSENFFIEHEEKILNAIDKVKSYESINIVNNFYTVLDRFSFDGIHLGQSDIPLDLVKYISNDKIIGVSCYNNFNLAKDAVRYDIDYVSFGSYTHSLTKQNAKKMNKKELKKVSNFSLLPKTIIGGIDLSNIDDQELKNFEMIAASKGIMECNDLDKLFMLAKK